jgi:single-strand DNA-binding protein
LRDLSRSVVATPEGSSTGRGPFTGGDAEARTCNNGSTFTVLSVATKRSRKNAAGEWESRTEWHRCIAFGKVGDFAASLKKGAHVQVEGDLRSREYDKDGVKHKVFECRLESILKLDRAAHREESEAGDDPDAFCGAKELCINNCFAVWLER